MVLAVVGHPLVDRPFERVRAHDGEGDLDRAGCLEGPVREVTVVADGDPETGDRPEANEQTDVDPGHQAPIDHGDNAEQSERRSDDEDPDGDLHGSAEEDCVAVVDLLEILDKRHGDPFVRGGGCSTRGRVA